MVGLLRQEEYTFTLISGFGPVLSAMMISAVTSDRRSKPKPGAWALTFALVMIVAGFLRWISRVWWNHTMNWTVLPGDLLLVSLAAFVVASAFSSNEGVSAVLRPYLNWRVSPVWIVIALTLWPVITMLGNYIGQSLGLPMPAPPARPDVPLPLAVLVSLAWTVFFNGALGEEAGWRGYALPRLQQRYSPLVSSLILGAIWGAFHWVFYFMGMSGPWYMFWVWLGAIPLAVVFTWLYNRTKGKSLLPVLLLHASMNATNDYLPRIKPTVYAVLGVVVLVVIFTDRMWRKSPQDSGKRLAASRLRPTTPGSTACRHGRCHASRHGRP